MEDTSLDEFLEQSSEVSESDESETDTDGTSTGETPTDGSEQTDVEPTVAISQWTPEGDICVECGTSATRRWEDEQRQVCSDCKEW